MDILMPEMDGYEAMSQIKATITGSSTPVVAITASVMREERQKALDHGFDGFLMKPVQMEDLFEEIRRLTSVAYLYEDILSARATAKSCSVHLVKNLASLQDDLLADMHNALTEGDMAILRSLIVRVGESEPALASALRQLVDTYAYDTLSELFAKEEPLHAHA